ncbi:MAG: TonB-dependent receptor [Filomicrobium sp.]
MKIRFATTTAVLTLSMLVPHMAAQAQQQLSPIVIESQGGAPAVSDPIGKGRENSVLGAANSGGAQARADQSAQTPVNARQIVPSSLEGYSTSATRVSEDTFDERRDRNLNEALKKVSGIVITNDDGAAHHGGISIHGSAPRRGRKVLLMEDGHVVNLALWLDPSVHFAPPYERLEAFEVIRGPVTSHGPNNNFGIINLRNLSPFGPDEVGLSFSLGWTDNGDNDQMDISNRRHAHIRQSFNNVGVVASYTGANQEGAWNTEVLRFDDFYGSIGWKGTNQDLIVNYSYAKQRDNYDESNLEAEDGEPGDPERLFQQFGHDKLAFAPGAAVNTYAGEIHRGQLTHNLYINRDTTISTRVYAQSHRRDRYQIVTLEDDPTDVDDDEAGLVAVFEDDELLIPEDSMFGRLRTFKHIGAETRAEFANLPLMGGMKHDIQAGIRYEYQEMTNRNFLGASGQILEDGDVAGLTIFERNLDADTVSAFLQSNIHVTQNFNVVPGVRFEWYEVNRQNKVVAEEEGEAEEIEDDECGEIRDGLDECLEIEGINRDPIPNESYDSANVLPGISFAYTGFNRTTVYGGYHRGQSTAVLRNEDFPAPDEIGDNFQLGVRSTAVKGLTFDVAGYYTNLKDYQFGQSFSTASDRGFGRADEVRIFGAEVYGRLDSQAITGGPWNVFAEATYSYANGEFVKGTSGQSGEDEDDPTTEVSIAGNQLPEIIPHVAVLTLGIAHKPAGGWGWNASASYTYRGNFFTDEFETPFGGDGEGEAGEVPDVWLLSARASLQIADTDTYLWVSGTNLTDELYITDREDGLKPGQARTFWTGVKMKF